LVLVIKNCFHIYKFDIVAGKNTYVYDADTYIAEIKNIYTFVGNKQLYFILKL